MKFTFEHELLLDLSKGVLVRIEYEVEDDQTITITKIGEESPRRHSLRVVERLVEEARLDYENKT